MIPLEKSEPTITFAIIYRVYHPEFPENKKSGGEQVIQQSVTSIVDGHNDETETQAKIQACSCARRMGKSAFPDDVECTAKFLRSERRENGRRPSAVVRAKRRAKTTLPIITPPVIPPTPTRSVKPQQAAMTFR
ncbi:MAG: hypothetical protein NTY30_01690 [Candidatus Berkelbacteria bacterium]|nr:hypothetical protein [Candidatus Berkelbacteria bacterium]